MPGCLRHAFVFVCQAGQLEIKALLLAASLRRNLRCDFELIAAVPTPADSYGMPGAATLSLLERLGVRIVEISNEIAPDYPIGNKVSCLKIATTCDRLIFLDTDMVLARPLATIPGGSFPFSAKPADLPNVLDHRQWRRAYAAGGVRVPDARVATTVYGKTVLPYFNAGFIAIDPLTRFGQTWLTCCKKIDAKWGIRLKRPHLDQIALPVAVQKLQLPYLCLDERYNFPAHIKPIDPDNPPFFAHYHSADVLRREPMLVSLVRDLCSDEPELSAMLESSPDFAPMLQDSRALATDRTATCRRILRPAIQGRRPSPELIITGVPRSGTSYLCNLLSRFDNCVMINEPDGVARSLRKEPIPFGVATFYRDMRRDVLEGRHIQNKLRDGKVTDETLDANELTSYLPEVINDQFVLGVKNPLGFLSRLHGLRRAMPHARVVVCVRNPFDTIASWKTTFSHLQTALVASLWNGGLRDPSLSSHSRGVLQDVAGIKSIAWRRAAWWRYLADLVLDAGPGIIVVPYRVAVTDPLSVVEKILGGYDHGALREPIEPSRIRNTRRAALDDEDRQAIRALCGEAAIALGVNEDEEEHATAPALGKTTYAMA